MIPAVLQNIISAMCGACCKFRMLLTLSVGILFCTTSKAQTLSPATIITANPTAQQLLDSLNGGGATFSNPKLVYGMPRQTLIFTNGKRAGLGIDGGVMFSTGNTSDELLSRNAQIDASVYNVDQIIYDHVTGEAIVDPDLNEISESANHDMLIYTFDVKLNKDMTALRVAFQFGSEEYPDYVGTDFNDAFGFFVTGPGISGTFNMARLPQSKNPISINTVNYGIAGYGWSPQADNPVLLDLSQGAFYINNGHTTQTMEAVGGGSGKMKLILNENGGPVPVFVEYNGLTKLIKYDLLGLTPGATYTFKVAIADASDGGMDSGVFIDKVQGVRGADVELEKTVDNPQPNIGEEVEFTLTASNRGPYDSRTTKVTDLLPSGCIYMGHTASKGTYDPLTGIWNIGALQSIYEKATLTIRALTTAKGNYTNMGVIHDEDLDPDPANNYASASLDVSAGCIESILFLDDFGISNASVNAGRMASLYMPAKGFWLSRPYPLISDPDETGIGKGYYATVAPAYIKSGWNPTSLADYFWTPALGERNIVFDRSGTVSGAVMAVNGGKTIKPFYERGATFEYGRVYKLSLWVYAVNGPVGVVVDIKDKKTGAVLSSFEPENISINGWYLLSNHFKVPAKSALACTIGDVVISIRTNFAMEDRGNDFYLDNVRLERLKDDSSCQAAIDPSVFCADPPPKKKIISNPVLPAKIKPIPLIRKTP